MAGLVEAVYGYKRGDDGGCFAAALAAVRRFGGVLEHPAHSDAWHTFYLPEPPPTGGWVAGICGGWSCHVELGHYGLPARKQTWLYACGADHHLPELKWGPYLSDAPGGGWWLGKGRGHAPVGAQRMRGSSAANSRTPPELRDELLTIARSALPSLAILEAFA